MSVESVSPGGISIRVVSSTIDPTRTTLIYKPIKKRNVARKMKRRKRGKV
jgi:hypothetical protein